jgi:hypothetical protein
VCRAQPKKETVFHCTRSLAACTHTKGEMMMMMMICVCLLSTKMRAGAGGEERKKYMLAWCFDEPHALLYSCARTSARLILFPFYKKRVPFKYTSKPAAPLSDSFLVPTGQTYFGLLLRCGRNMLHLRKHYQLDDIPSNHLFSRSSSSSSSSSRRTHHSDV